MATRRIVLVHFFGYLATKEWFHRFKSLTHEQNLLQCDRHGNLDSKGEFLVTTIHGDSQELEIFTDAVERSDGYYPSSSGYALSAYTSAQRALLTERRKGTDWEKVPF